MIHRNAIIEWRETAPWKELRFVEQDLALSRALISIYQDEVLRTKLAFRGGTAIYKLYLTPAPRYSEDLDFVQIEAEPIGTVLDRLKSALTFLGEPKSLRKQSNNTLIFRFAAEEPRNTMLRLKIEINCKEHLSVLGQERQSFGITNQWFSGNCDVTTFFLNELIGTKIRALYQRRKGRDLFDLYTALQSNRLDIKCAVDCFKEYMMYNGIRLPTAKEYSDNLNEKMNDLGFRTEVYPFLLQGIEYDVDKAHRSVLEQIVDTL